ncbi:hypothetical protein [Janthinobacterium sp. UMAB-60]|uniref:hypothetical protein n=1 Tax=Janthinobacterium sp. UMAB-60 TaxID=1365365 RepID=UPI001C57DC43|nr:hypothetical protein [Janthinobacterium sp. UMAB-60]
MLPWSYLFFNCKLDKHDGSRLFQSMVVHGHAAASVALFSERWIPWLNGGNNVKNKYFEFVNIGEYLAISNGAESGIASFVNSTILHRHRLIPPARRGRRHCSSKILNRLSQAALA